MSFFSIKAFTGETPRLPDDRLPEGGAKLAKNCDFSAGELRPLKALGTLYPAATTPVRGLFTDDGLRFYVWDKPTRAYLHPTIDDTVGRVIYQAHGQGVRVALKSGMTLSSLTPGAPAQSWAAGVAIPPQPAAALIGEATGSGESTTISYVLVAINQWGEESAPSAPVTIEVPEGQGVRLTATHVADTDQVPLQGLLVYRTYGQTADFILQSPTPRTPVSGNDYQIDDSSTAAITSTTLQSAEWDPPPAGLGNLTYLGNGFFAASLGKDVLLSEPYRPHAWPYRMTFPNGVVGIVAVEGGAIVTTQAGSYTIYGAHPTQMGQDPLVPQAGVSDTAMTPIEQRAVFVANDGLVSVRGGQASLEASQQLFTRKAWRGRYKASFLNLRLAAHDGRLIGIVDPSYPIAATGESFVLDLEESGGTFARLDVGTPLYGASIAATEDALYVGTATGFAEFAGSNTDLAYTWQSGDVLYTRPVAFGAGIIDCTGAVTLEVFADGALIHTEAFTTAKAFRLPPVKSASRWSVRLTGTGVVRAIDLGPSFAALKEV